MIKRLLRLVGRWARKPVNYTSWVAEVTPTDRPKSVRNRCLIELFCGVVCVVTLPFWHFCWCRGFCHRTESDLFLFLLYQRYIVCVSESVFEMLTFHIWTHYDKFHYIQTMCVSRENGKSDRGNASEIEALGNNRNNWSFKYICTILNDNFV